MYVSPTILCIGSATASKDTDLLPRVDDNSWVDWEIIEGHVAKTFGGMEWQIFFLEVVKIFWKVWW